MLDNFHDTTNRLNQSIVAARYMNPDGIGRYVISALHTWFGRVIGTFLIQQGATRLVGEIAGTLAAGIALGVFAGLSARPAGRPPRLVLLLGGFFVLTVGGLGLRGATALIGNDIVSGFGDLRDFLIQMPTVAVALALGVLATEQRPSAR